MTKDNEELERSFSGRVWRRRVAESVSEPFQSVARQSGLPNTLAPLLAYRQLESPGAVRDFLNPRLLNLVDPSGLRDMDKAVARLVTAVEQGEAIAVFGDYDVDGATSSALLDRYFRGLGLPVRVYIPERLTEGYGPNIPAMEQLAAERIRVVITVDCGVTAFAALEAAAQFGLEVIVTDHHQPQERLPVALAVIDPNRRDDDFPHKELAGVGVAFYLAMALNRALQERGWFAQGRQKPDLKPLLDLVAVGTIADVARMTGLNRLLTATGLQVVRNRTSLGLRVLMEKAGIGATVEAGQIGFHLGPRINAGGRMGKGSLGYELLSTDNPSRAHEIAALMEKSNQERQSVEQEILEQAFAQVEEGRLHERCLGLVVAQEGWHPGVIGIVASRIVERYHRPVLVVALDAASGLGKGSGRSIPGVDLLAAVTAGGSHLLEFGGHKAAAGFTIATAQLEPFRHAFDEAIRQNNAPELFVPALAFDFMPPLGELTLETAHILQRFQPFGMGNPEPVVVARGVRIEGVRVLKERHIKCQLTAGSQLRLEAIGFGMLPGPLGDGLLDAAARNISVDCAGQLTINQFQNRTTVQLLLKDVRPCLL